MCRVLLFLSVTNCVAPFRLKGFCSAFLSPCFKWTMYSITLLLNITNYIVLFACRGFRSITTKRYEYKEGHVIQFRIRNHSVRWSVRQSLAVCEWRGSSVDILRRCWNVPVHFPGWPGKFCSRIERKWSINDVSVCVCVNACISLHTPCKSLFMCVCFYLKSLPAWAHFWRLLSLQFNNYHYYFLFFLGRGVLVGYSLEEKERFTIGGFQIFNYERWL